MYRYVESSCNKVIHTNNGCTASTVQCTCVVDLYSYIPVGRPIDISTLHACPISAIMSIVLLVSAL